MFYSDRDLKECFVLHLHDGNKVYHLSDFIDNAKEQESKGIKPSFAFYGKDASDITMPAGWLVYSTYEDGAGVVFKRIDGEYIFVRGWQGDFVMV